MRKLLTSYYAIVCVPCTLLSVDYVPGDIISACDCDGKALPCNGQRVSVAEFPELFAVIQYTYGGAGETFGVPDLRNPPY